MMNRLLNLSFLYWSLMPMHTYALLYILCVAFSQITLADVEVDALCDIKKYTNPNSWSTYSPCDTAYLYPCAEWLYGVACSYNHVTELWLSSLAHLLTVLGLWSIPPMVLCQTQ